MHRRVLQGGRGSPPAERRAASQMGRVKDEVGRQAKLAGNKAAGGESRRGGEADGARQVNGGGTEAERSQGSRSDRRAANQASAIADQIESMRKARRDLQLWIQMLGTDRSKDVAAAQTNLLKKPDIALGMLLEAAESIDNPILAANALEALRLLNRPEVTAPAMLAVLRRTEQQQVWPAQ